MVTGRRGNTHWTPSRQRRRRRRGRSAVVGGPREGVRSVYCPLVAVYRRRDGRRGSPGVSRTRSKHTGTAERGGDVPVGRWTNVETSASDLAWAFLRVRSTRRRAKGKRWLTAAGKTGTRRSSYLAATKDPDHSLSSTAGHGRKLYSRRRRDVNHDPKHRALKIIWTHFFYFYRFWV